MLDSMNLLVVFQLTSLDPDTNYVIRIKVVDKKERISAPSPESQARTGCSGIYINNDSFISFLLLQHLDRRPSMSTSIHRHRVKFDSVGKRQHKTVGCVHRSNIDSNTITAHLVDVSNLSYLVRELNMYSIHCRIRNGAFVYAPKMRLDIRNGQKNSS